MVALISAASSPAAGASAAKRGILQVGETALKPSESKCEGRLQAWDSLQSTKRALQPPEACYAVAAPEVFRNTSGAGRADERRPRPDLLQDIMLAALSNLNKVPPHDGSTGKPGGLLQQRRWPALLLLRKGRHGRLFHFFKFPLRGFFIGFGRGFFIIPTTGQHKGTKHHYQHHQSFHRPAPIRLSVCGSGIAPGAFLASFPWSGLRFVAYSALLHGRALWLNRDCPCDIPQ